MHVEISITAGPAKGQRFIFDKPDRFLFGRALDARVSLPNDPYVSRQHFLLEISPPACKVTDLGSKNGTFVNGVRYGGRKDPAEGVQQASEGVRNVALKNGDKIIVGDTQMKVIILNPPGEGRRDNSGATLSYTPVPNNSPADKKDDSNPMGVLGQLLRDAAKQKQDPQQPEPLDPDPPKPPRPASSTKVGSNFPDIVGYEIEEMIDRGGMGIVYKAIDVTTRHLVAIKVMLPQMAANPDNVYAFKREIDVTRQLQHSNIVQLFDHGKTQKLLYFVLEYINGMNLYQFLKYQQGRLALDGAASIMLDSLDGLAHAHYAEVKVKIAEGKTESYTGIVHRDLKPQNVLLGHTGEVWQAKLSDFGISKSFESAGFTNITKPGEVLGTPMYWPREQITHYKYLNPATDVFSIAAVFYELLTGKWVRDGFENLFERCKKQKRVAAISDYMQIIVGNPAIPIRKRNPTIPEPVAQVIDRALLEAEVPYDEGKMREALSQLRYPDAKTFKEALQQAFERSGLTEERIREAQLRLGAADKEMFLDSPPPPKAPSKTSKKSQATQKKKKKTQEKPEEAKTEGSIFFSIMQASPDSKEVALLVFDLEESSAYLREVGDTYFSKTISEIYKRARQHSSAPDLMFMKSTGDGFLAVFSSLPSAFSLALSFLKKSVQADVQSRMALHWGAVKLAQDGDVLGAEVHRVFRAESVQMQDQINPDYDGPPIPVSDRIVITEQGLAKLREAEQAKFHQAGRYVLKGFTEPCDLWVLNKRL